MIILGSTGSIGTNALALAREFKFEIGALACNKNYKLLNEQISEFRPKLVFIADKAVASEVRGARVFTGDIAEFLRACQEELGAVKVINALVGFSGLVPSRVCQELGFELCLANKESLVAGGAFLDTKKINPIDSEHFGLKFLLKSRPKPTKLIITASGGAVYKTPISQLGNVTPQIALRHPNWSMGAKITIDSATMANKLFEVLEAFWLYRVKNIEAMIERSSRIHALVEFADGSTTAHISATDMKLAIAHAIGFGEQKILSNLNILGAQIKFESISAKKYPIFTLASEVLARPHLGCAINAANEEAVYAFLARQIRFTDISKCVFKALDKFGGEKPREFADVLDLDRKVREWTRDTLKIGAAK